MNPKSNADTRTIGGIGDEWSRFDQSAPSGEELAGLFNEYFHIFPWEELLRHENRRFRPLWNLPGAALIRRFTSGQITHMMHAVPQAWKRFNSATIPHYGV